MTVLAAAEIVFQSIIYNDIDNFSCDYERKRKEEKMYTSEWRSKASMGCIYNGIPCITNKCVPDFKHLFMLNKINDNRRTDTKLE